MTQKRVTISTKINEEDYAKIELMARVDGLSVTALVKLLVMGYKDSEIVIKGGEIQPPIEEEYYEDEFGTKIERICDKLREGNYPESFISKWKGTILDGMRSQVEIMPKKYDPRRMRNDDWGC